MLCRCSGHTFTKLWQVQSILFAKIYIVNVYFAEIKYPSFCIVTKVTASVVYSGSCGKLLGTVYYSCGVRWCTVYCSCSIRCCTVYYSCGVRWWGERVGDGEGNGKGKERERKGGAIGE